jgi:site-specific DNA recombinase
VRREPGEAARVAEIFASYLEAGQRILGLTKHLSTIRATTATGNTRWNSSTVRQRQRNPIYTGKVYGGRPRAHQPRARRSALQPVGRPGSSRTMTTAEAWTRVAEVPAIITAEQFAHVQAKRARKQQFARRNNTAHPSLLRALVSCGLCQTGGCGRTSAGHSYYTCRGKV